MGNEQSTSGEGEEDSHVLACVQRVSNGDGTDCSAPYCVHTRLPTIADTGVQDDHTSRPSASVRSVSTGQQFSDRSPFATRSLRIHSHKRPPTRCSSAMDNVAGGATAHTHQSRTNSASNLVSSMAAGTSPTTRSPRPGNMCRQRSAVSFSASASGAFAASGLNVYEPGAPKRPAFAAMLGLSAYQQQQIVQSWPRIQQSGGHTAGVEIFRKLTCKFPAIKETFQKAEVVERLCVRSRGFDIYKDHGRLLFDVFQTAINALNEPADGVVDMCKGYGAKHLALRGEGFQTRMWDDLAELLVEHVTRMDAIRRHREVMRAWTALIMFLVEKMKEGYDQGLRKASSPIICSPYTNRPFNTALSMTDDDSPGGPRDMESPVEYAAPVLYGRRSGSLRKEEKEEVDDEIMKMSNTDL